MKTYHPSPLDSKVYERNSIVDSKFVTSRYDRPASLGFNHYQTQRDSTHRARHPIFHNNYRNTSQIYQKSTNIQNSQQKSILKNKSKFSQSSNFQLKSFTENKLRSQNRQSYNRDNDDGLGHIKQLILYDYCGCENTVKPCDIIASTFLKAVSIQEIKSQFQNLRVNKQQSLKLSYSQHKELFQYLPGCYPQIFQSQLNNIACLIRNESTTKNTSKVDSPNKSEFLCMAWIQYHCKFQYLTYFIYCDLKQSFAHQQKFIYSVDLGLIKYDTSLQLIQKEIASTLQNTINYSNNLYAFQAFITQFYSSIAAIVVPLTQYSRLLKLLLEKGHTILAKLLILLLGKKKTIFFDIYEMYIKKQHNALREYSRELNWDQFFEQIEAMK